MILNISASQISNWEQVSLDVCFVHLCVWFFFWCANSSKMNAWKAELSELQTGKKKDFTFCIPFAKKQYKQGGTTSNRNPGIEGDYLFYCSERRYQRGVTLSKPTVCFLLFLTAGKDGGGCWKAGSERRWPGGGQEVRGEKGWRQTVGEADSSDVVDLGYGKKKGGKNAKDGAWCAGSDSYNTFCLHTSTFCIKLHKYGNSHFLWSFLMSWHFVFRRCVPE